MGGAACRQAHNPEYSHALYHSRIRHRHPCSNRFLVWIRLRNGSRMNESHLRILLRISHE